MKKYKTYLLVFILDSIGLGLVAFYSWQIAIGLIFFLWGENIATVIKIVDRIEAKEIRHLIKHH